MYTSSGSRSIRSAKLIDIVRRNERITTLLPIVILVAEEAAVFRVSQFGRLPVMTLLARADAGNQDVRGLHAADCFGVARLAIDADMRVVAEDGVRQPYGFDVGRRDFRPIFRRATAWVLEVQRVTLLTRLMP